MVESILGRNLIDISASYLIEHGFLTPPFIKSWCESKGIKVLQPITLKENIDIVNDDLIELKEILKSVEVAIVASYGKILPADILNLPSKGFLNIHPSNLPKFRGPSPIESVLLTGANEITITLMKLDTGMDTGDILVQGILDINLEDTALTLKHKCGNYGATLIVNCLDAYINGNIKLIKQNDDEATICKFIKKEDGEVKLIDNLNEIKNKYRAYYPWPGIFFFHDLDGKIIRVKISSIKLNSNNLDDLIEKVIPEGKKEMSWNDFKNGYIKK
jgi:methionyl-tRNA formyltransferase